MASIIQGSANGDIEFIAGTGRSIVFTTDTLGSIDINILATQGYVTSQINNIIDGAPGALDTLNELAAALNDDSSFASDVMDLLNNKIDAIEVYTSTEIDTLLSDKANSADVYTITEIDNALTTKADVSTSLSGYGITDAYTSTEIDTLLSDKANSADVYTSTDVDTLLLDKQNKFVDAPTTSIGQSGDLLGQIAFSATYIYYCTADYTDGLSDIWARTPLTLETW